jgi:hypothetical protein
MAQPVAPAGHRPIPVAAEQMHDVSSRSKSPRKRADRDETSLICVAQRAPI